MIEKKLIENKLEKYGQEHILKSIEKIDDDIANQISQIDFEEMQRLYQNAKKVNKQDICKIDPIDYIDKEKIKKEEREELQLLGEKVIKNDQYAVITMAGGQGTRLGYNGPKGTFKLSIGKYIFEILAENLKKAKIEYNIFPYWYIMTSNQNDNQTEEFFKEHNYFGYDKQKVKFFKQNDLPLLTAEGKFVIEENRIKMGSNGNGGIYSALKRENILADMKEKNIKWVYVCGVDNIMVNPIDPLFIGLTIKNNMPIASKSVVKAFPEEKVGVFCKRNEKPGIVEYIELSEKMRIECDKNGNLIYGDANILSHLFDIKSLEKISNQTLEYHSAVKNGLYKFESFIFDGFKYVDDMLVMRVRREDEFAPIKNKEGVDSPETAVKIYKEKYGG